MLEFGKTKKPFLSKPELEAFLATAVCPVMKNVRMTKEMRLRKVYTRGLTIGALFMQGVEYGCVANDACGAPLPWQLTCPWEFFDGKIFHLKLIKACSGSPLLDVCDNRVQQVVMVERLRDAILGDRNFEFAEPKIGGRAPDARPVSAPSAPRPAAGAGPGAIPKKIGAPAEAPAAPSAGARGAAKSSDPADAYATVYAAAYMAYCNQNGGKSKPSEAEAYAAGYAAAQQQAPSVGRLAPTRATRPPAPRAFNPNRTRGAPFKVVRQAAAYANYHSFNNANSSPFRRPFQRRGGGRGGGNFRQSEDQGFGGYGGVDFRVPYGYGNRA